MQKRWVKVVLAVAVVIVVAVLLIPLFVNADTFRPALESQLSTALGRKVTLGKLSFSLLSGSLVAQDVTVADDSAYSSTPFLGAKSMHVGVETGKLILHRQLQVTDLTADSPDIHLIHGQNGKWNYSSLGQRTGAATSQQASEASTLSVGEVKITNGTVTVSSQPAAGAPLVYTNVNLTVKPLDLAASSPFDLSASLPGQGTVKVSGKLGPVVQKDLSDTPLDASLELKHFDPVAAGALQPGQGISMLANVQAQVNSDGRMLTSTGKVHAERLQMARTGAPAPNPVDVDYTISDNLDAQTGDVRDLAIKTGSVAAHVTGTYRLTPQAVAVNLKLNAPNLPIDQVEALLPAFGVRLPTGSTLRGGTLSANLSIDGPVADAQIAGPVEVNNTELTGFSLGSKIQGLAGGSARGSGTSIRTLRAQVRSSPARTELTNIYAVVPEVGSATGAGTVTPPGTLNFHLVAKLNSSSGIGAVANTAVGALGGILGNFVHTAATNGIPINITGSSSNPVIQADIGSMLAPQTRGVGKPGQVNPASLIQGLFGHH